MLGLSGENVPKFVKRFADLRGEITRAVGEYIEEVESGSFPAPEHSYGMGAAAARERTTESAIYGATRTPKTIKVEKVVRAAR
jgi:hypothetical protein